MVDCIGEMESFLEAMEPLGIGSTAVMQFPYVARAQDVLENERGVDFMSRLKRFLPHYLLIPSTAVEVRNARWVGDPLLHSARKQRGARVEHLATPCHN